MSQPYMTVCWMSRAARCVSVTLMEPAATAALSTSISMREIGIIAAASRSGSLSASCIENSEIGTRLWAPRLRRVPSGSHHSWRRIVKARRRSIGFDSDSTAARRSSSDSRMVSSSSAKSSSSLPSKYW
jgi:hypothetical protein